MNQQEQVAESGLVEDYSTRLQILHYVALDGVIIWPATRYGEPAAGKGEGYDQ